MSEYRLKRIEGVGWFAQVNLRELFFKNWYTIGNHMNGYGLYSEEHIDHPVQSKVDAENIVIQYKKSLELKKIEYFDLEGV